MKSRVDKRTNMRLLGVFGRVRETIRICCRNTRCPFSVGHEQCSNIGVVSHRVVTKGWLWYGKQRENSGSYLSYQLQDYDGGCRCQKDSEHWHVGFGIYVCSIRRSSMFICWMSLLIISSRSPKSPPCTKSTCGIYGAPTATKSLSAWQPRQDFKTKWA